MTWLPPLGGLLLAAVVSLTPLNARASAGVAVDLELVVAVDISHSMDDEEQKLQREGYVAAFRHPEVLNAILTGRYKRIAVAYVEWAGTGRFFLSVPWTLIDSSASAIAFADRLKAAPMRAASRTSISGGLAFAADQFEGSGFVGLRKVIDVSGDGPNNMGPRVDATRDHIVGRGIVINGLPLMLRPSFMAGFADMSELNDYYRDCVIGGFGSFLITVERHDELVDAIRRKLVLEMSGMEPAVRIVRIADSERPKVDCLIGEKIWDSGWD